MTAKHTPAQTLDRPPITEREDALRVALITALPYVETAEHDDAYTPGAVRKVVNLIRAALRAYDPPTPGAITPEDPRAILREIRAAWPADYDEAVSGADLCETIGALIPRIDAALNAP